MFQRQKAERLEVGNLFCRYHNDSPYNPRRSGILPDLMTIRISWTGNPTYELLTFYRLLIGDSKMSTRASNLGNYTNSLLQYVANFPASNGLTDESSIQNTLRFVKAKCSKGVDN